MKVVLISSHSANNKAVFDLTTKNHSDYCRLHGYFYRPIEEVYHPRSDIPFVLTLLENFDAVVNIGCDVVIQKQTCPIERFIKGGLTVGRELNSGTLNGDLLIMNKAAVPLLREIDSLQKSAPDTQTIINRLESKRGNIFVEPLLQVAAPTMNPSIDYSSICVEDYFAVHHHTIGKVPLVAEKIKGLSADLNI